MPSVTTSDLSWRLLFHNATSRHSPDIPIGLHDYPKQKKGAQWYGVGPVLGPERAVSWFDIRIGNGRDYDQVNRMLATACRTNKLAYVERAPDIQNRGFTLLADTFLRGRATELRRAA